MVVAVQLLDKQPLAVVLVQVTPKVVVGVMVEQVHQAVAEVVVQLQVVQLQRVKEMLVVMVIVLAALALLMVAADQVAVVAQVALVEMPRLA
jgi:hypothetical protein